MYTYTTDSEDMVKNANTVFETVINGLVKEGFLNKEQEEKLLTEYGVITYKPNMFSTVIRKLFGKDVQDKFFIRFIKLI